MRRGDDLVQDGSLSRREYDQTVAALQQAQAQFRQAMASDEVAHQDILTVQVGRDGLIAQMQAAEAQMHALNYQLCPHCDYMVEKDFLRCPSCLQRLKEP